MINPFRQASYVLSAHRLSQLPEDYALPLISFHLQGKPHKEISDIMGVPVGTVKTRIHRGHKLLVEKLKGNGNAFSLVGGGGS